MPKIPKNFRIDSDVLAMLDKLIEVQEETLSIKLSQTAMLEYLIKNEYRSLGFEHAPNHSKGGSE